MRLACHLNRSCDLMLASATVIVVVAGCSGKPETFDELVTKVKEVAANTRDTDDSATFTVRVIGSDRQDQTITFAVDDSSSGATSKATVAWAKRDGNWRVTSVTSDWSHFGLGSIVTEQQLIDKVCRQLDDQYTSPRSDPEKSGEFLEKVMPPEE